MATDKRKRAIRALAAERGISYTAAMREHDAERTPWIAPHADLMTFTVGTNEDTGNPISIDFDKFPHALVVGQTGTGKTNFARNLTMQVLTRAEGMNIGSLPPVHIFDNPSGELAREWNASAHVQVTQAGEDPVEHASAITDEMKRRYEARAAGDEQTPTPLLVILDSYQMPGVDRVEDRVFWEHASNWIRIGHSAGLIVVVMQHNPAPATDGSIRFFPEIRANLSNRIAFGSLKPSEAVLLFGEVQAESTHFGARMEPGHALIQQARGEEPVAMLVPVVQ